MQLLSVKKTTDDRRIQADEKRTARLKAERMRNEAEKSLALSISDWDKEKKKKWDEFCKWNQEIQQKKALILREIEQLEHKRDVLIENLNTYLP